MALVTEDLVENQTIEWFKEIGYQYVCGYDLAFDGGAPEREDYISVILKGRLSSALQRLNPDLPQASIDHALTELLNPNTPGLLNCNRLFHSWLTKGIKVEFEDKGQQIGKLCKLIDFENVTNNDWLVVNQFTIEGTKFIRRPDVIVFINGIPLVVIELKNPSDEQATIWSAYNQLQTYKDNIPDLFFSNVGLVISDGLDARLGSLTADETRFSKWRTIDGTSIDPLGKIQSLETLIRGFFKKEIFLEFLRYHCLFMTFDTDVKVISAYHQFYAVKHAVENVVKVSQEENNSKGGVVWHTQGAGKSLEMTCLAGQLLSHTEMKNPTIVVVTDRQDLDGQLFDSFSSAGELLGESPKKAESRLELRELLNNRPSGGIIFTTIQKFGLEKQEEKFPELTNRQNVVVMCDEAHRSQYGFKGRIDQKTGEIKYGLAKALRDGLPNATFLAFTGTPISHEDRDTRAVFGDYISIYDIQQAVEDGATVKIYYESRLAKLDIPETNLIEIDDKIDEIFEEDENDNRKKKSSSKWARLEALVSAQPRLELIARDFINHYETRLKTQPGKAMFVAMSRDICARLYDEIVKLKPDWHSDDHLKGKIKVIMHTAASEEMHMQRHNLSKSQKKDLEKRFKNPNDELQIVIVRDMWLTGFDAPCLSTMYVDKPMKGANLAQAIARVNRVFHDKPGGLIVDYIGIAPQLKEALATYAASKGRGRPTIDTNEALKQLEERIMIARDILHPVDWSNFKTEALKLMPICLEQILSVEDGKKRYCDVVLQMTKAFALCGTLDGALKYAEEVAFHQALRAPLIKYEGGDGDTPIKNVDYLLRQLISESLITDGVEDVFKLAGLSSPDISILSDEFLKEVMNMPQKNLAVELLNKLLKDEIKTRFRKNPVKDIEFSEMLKGALNKYKNRSIEASQVIIELIEMAKKFKKDLENSKKLNLNDDERAFYDALSKNKSAKDFMGDEKLQIIAREIAVKLRNNITVDWSVRESVRSKLRVMIKSLLKRYKYPPDGEDEAIQMVLMQAEHVSNEWSRDSYN